jgi:hypothetical protein
MRQFDNLAIRQLEDWKSRTSVAIGEKNGKDSR